MHQDKRKKNREAAALQKYAHILLDIVICIYMLLILVVMPFYNEEGYAHIGTDKSVFFSRVSTGAGKIAVPLLIIYLISSVMISWRKRGNASRLRAFLRERLSITDLFAGAYVISLLLSYLFSHYKSDALWGASGWYMGLYRQLALMGTYFLISKCWKPKKWIFYTVLPVSAVVFLLGYLNRFGIYPLDLGKYGSAFISTIGNINWYCGYLVSVFFAGAALLWQGISYKAWQRLLLMIHVLLGFASLITQGSNSGIVAMAAVFSVMFWLSITDSGRMFRFWQEMTLLGGACLMTYGIQVSTGRRVNYEDFVIETLSSKEAAVFLTTVSLVMLALAAVNRKRKSPVQEVWHTLARVGTGLMLMLLLMYTVTLTANTLRPGSIGMLSRNPAFQFTNTWGSSRGATWKAGALCFWEQDLLHKLVGVGPDAMSSYIYQGGSPRLQEIVKTTFSDLRLTNAHNEWLTVLADTGISGFVSYVGLMVSGIVRFLSKKDSNAVSRACGLCLLGYTVNNMFSFQQAMNTATIFVIFGIGEAYIRHAQLSRSITPQAADGALTFAAFIKSFKQFWTVTRTLPL